MSGSTLDAERRRPVRVVAFVAPRRPTKETPVPTEEELKAELEKLKAENATLKARGSRGISLKVSEKGAVSVYGLGRFPVTLYKEQWQKLLGLADEIRAFLKEHDAELKAKS
jgi:hypothetical protein